MPRILYLSHAPPPVYDIIRGELPAGFELVTLAADDDAERRAKVVDCEVVIVAATPLRRDVIEAARVLRLVHHQGVGYHDTVDCAALAARAIPLALTPEGSIIGVAEHAVLLALAVCKRLPYADAELRNGRWHINALRPESRELCGMTVGYLGMGRIGQAVAQRLAAFGTSGLYCDDAMPLPAARERELGLERVDFDVLLTRSDLLTLHLPLTPATRHIVDAAAIGRMKAGAIIINTARGGLIDETALHAALVAGRLGGAGLDVFESEPPAPSDPLLALRNVVATPHISAGTRDALVTKMRALFANVQRFYAGAELAHRVQLR
ncbi:MAG: 3-phosphoglycerate dehydrogenase [Myxococcales bacterium]|nr:3-phosphoglycerate dehydrogenase [Myxococcales bacterium]